MALFNLNIQRVYTQMRVKIGNTVFTDETTTLVLADGELNLVQQGIGNIDGTGNAADNQLYGNVGNNVLEGKAGLDLLVGDAGNDTYIIETPAAGVQADVVIERANEGHDAVFIDYDYRLAANVEDGTLTGTEGWQLYGNQQDNVLTGNSGDNLLVGLGGADTMIGKEGNDIYFVTTDDETIIEQADEGRDAVFSGNVEGYVMPDNIDTYVMYATPNAVNNPHVSGTNIEAFGNDTDNLIFGNDLANVVHGNDGGDTLLGFLGADNLFGDAGDDVLDGGKGKDHLTGGEGFDFFRFLAQDQTAGSTNDTVEDFECGIDTMFFKGFGTAANGAFLDRLGASDEYRVVLGSDAPIDAPSNVHLVIHGQEPAITDVIFA